MENLWIRAIICFIKILIFFYDFITLPIYFLIQKPWQRKRESERVKAKIINNDRDTITFRSTEPPSFVHITILQSNIDTLEKMFNYVAKTHQTKRCLGTRQILSEQDELQQNGRIFKKYHLGDYKWKSFLEAGRLALLFGRGLRECGQEPKKNVIIFAETRAEWMIAAQGCFKQSISVVTIYATLGDDGIIHCINETEATTIITSHDLLIKFKILLNQCPNIDTIIFMEDQLHRTDISDYKKGIKIIPYLQVIGLGQNSKYECISPKPEDIAIIMYTSGSTGQPKGVLLTHKNCISTMKGFSDIVPVNPSDVLLGFLPLAHVFELLTECVCLITGMSIGYSTPLTLIDTSSKVMKGCKGDASILKPTCMASVPLILDRLTKGINEKINTNKKFHKLLFHYFYQYKIKWFEKGYLTPILDALIFHKISMIMGGKLRFLLSGGAPLSPETHEKINMFFSLNVVQGYGLTETTSAGTVMDYRDMNYGRVGAPLSVCDIRLMTWDDSQYNILNKPYPQGEIIIGGDCVALGYFKLPEKTMEEFYEDENGCRWFKTGDIGEMHNDGVLKIIDRKKDLVKLQAGEYISLGKIESEFKTNPYIDNICIYADSFQQFAVALIVPNQKLIEELGEHLGFRNQTFEELCSLRQIERAILQILNEHGEKCKLQKFEIPQAITLCSEIWTPDMGLVTAAFKLKRKMIEEKYQNDIKRMYATAGGNS